MEAESFFARWAKHNAEAAAERRAAETSQPSQPDIPAEEPPRPPPTIDEVSQLTRDSDFKPFVARGVDESVRRAAMKKLFADPHFNVMDGLDVYIEDYNQFEPIPAAMLATLNHAQALLDPLARLDNPLMRLIDAIEEKDRPAPRDTTQAAGEPPDTDTHGESPSTKEPPTHDDPVQGL